jgi:hypothetical protein
VQDALVSEIRAMRKTTLYKYNLRSPVRAARTAARPHTRCAHARRHAHAFQPADAGAERGIGRRRARVAVSIGWQRAG